MSAQLEDGYTRTANELLDHLMKQRLNGTQHSIIYCVIRNTYGFQRKSHEMSLTFISIATGIHKDLIKRELAKLIQFKVVKVFKEASFRSTREIGINKNIEEWEVHSESKGIQGTNQSTVSELVAEQGTNQSTPTGDESVHQERKSFKENKDIYIPAEINVLRLLNQYQVKTRGVYQVQEVESYIGPVEAEVVEEAIKRSEGKNIGYVKSVLNGFMEEGKTTLAAVKPKPVLTPAEKSKEPDYSQPYVPTSKPTILERNELFAGLRESEDAV